MCLMREIVRSGVPFGMYAEQGIRFELLSIGILYGLHTMSPIDRISSMQINGLADLGLYR